jgi:hypothetical protein
LEDDLTNAACWTVGRVEVSARADEALQLCFEDRKFSLLRVHILELSGEEGGDVFAGCVASLAERDGTADFIQCEASGLSGTDEPEEGDSCFIVLAVAVGLTRWGR